MTSEIESNLQQSLLGFQALFPYFFLRQPMDSVEELV